MNYYVTWRRDDEVFVSDGTRDEAMELVRALMDDGVDTTEINVFNCEDSLTSVWFR